MIAELRRAWLAGFFDGEGSIFLCVDRKTNRIEPGCSVVNTNRQNADAMKVAISEALGRQIRFRLKQRKDYRPLFRIEITTHADIAKLLEYVLPHLTGKKPQAMLMLEYLKVAPGKGSVDGFQAFHYDFVSRLRNMNRRFAKGEWQEISQRETERLAPLVDGETARSAWQHAEEDRNVLPLEQVAQE